MTEEILDFRQNQFCPFRLVQNGVYRNFVGEKNQLKIATKILTSWWIGQYGYLRGINVRCKCIVHVRFLFDAAQFFGRSRTLTVRWHRLCAVSQSNAARSTTIFHTPPEHNTNNLIFYLEFNTDFWLSYARTPTRNEKKKKTN